jgi:hypothetical protein
MSSVWEAGQFYVALSRCESLEGLKIINFDVSKIKANSRAVAFYESLVNTKFSYLTTLLFLFISNNSGFFCRHQI